MLEIWRAQSLCCAICGRELVRDRMHWPDVGWSVEHVWPRRRYAFWSRGNQLISHQLCNNRKGDRDPTGCEVLMLAAVNAQLGLALRTRPPPPPKPASLVIYADTPSAPGALAEALVRAIQQPRERGAENGQA